MNKKISYILLAVLWLTSCNQKEKALFANPSSEATGIRFSNQIKETDDLNILDYLYFYNGGGTAIGDINNDGLPDIFFSGNQVANKLYLNQGNLKFQDISEQAGIKGNSNWNTGAVMGDINGDGLLDIYVCAVVGINGFNGFNELYINNGDNTFTESASKYKLDFDTYSSSAALLDYDLDGDLDMYLLNHAIHTQESFGKAELRNKRNYETGDRLLRNDGESFTDVSKEAGIFGGVNGYGLGIAVSDFNQDGYPDIYVGNDFHEDDYFYINNQDGTFSEKLKDYFGHTSRFSMGNDVADINHDGLPDLISLDMLPEDESVLKSSEGDDNIQVQKLRTQQYGYHYQFTRNMLYVNQEDSPFLETALLSGVAATDWSWSALFGDYNQDGEQDLFIANGIPKRPNDLDYINFVSNEQIQKKIDNTKLVDQKALEMMPKGNAHNYIFKGSNNLKFEDKSKKWIAEDKLISGASAYGDLDNDGDLDLVVNNLNSEASLYINQTNNTANYLKIKLNYKGKNRFGLGTKVFAYSKDTLQFKELYSIRGFQASSEPIVHFGFSNASEIDSLKIIWPNKTYQVLKSVKTNQTLTVNFEDTKPFNYKSKSTSKNTLFKLVENNLGVNFKHTEDRYIDFNRHKLIPFQVSDRGPAFAVGDLNKDGKEDLYFGSSKYIPSQTFIQTNDGFVKQDYPLFTKDSIKEDVVAVIADFNNDSTNDVFVGSGGADFYNKAKPLLDSYYVNQDSIYTKQTLPDFHENASVVIESDYDQDGDLDLFIGAQTASNKYGLIPNSYILENNNGTFSIVNNEALKNVGMVTDAVWTDYNADGKQDLIVVGEWMAPTFFKNNGSELVKDISLDNLSGLWQHIKPFDIDHDGDMDYVLGNWGTNSKFKASEKHPMRMYVSDFDANGAIETIVCNYTNNDYFPILGLNELASQIVSLRKKFPTYKSFAGKPIDQVLTKNQIKKASVLQVQELRSGFLVNNNGTFTFKGFKNEMQVSPLMVSVTFDFNKDGKEELLIGGNYFGVTPYHGRFDSFPGALIKDENTVILGNKLGLNFNNKSIRHLNMVNYENEPYLFVTINNDSTQVYRIK